MNKLDFVNPIQLPRWCSGKEPICQCKRCRRLGFHPWVPKILWKRAFPLFLPGKLRGQRSLVGYSPWDGRVRHDWVIEHTGTHACMHTHTHTHILIHQFGYLKSRACEIWKYAIFESPIVVDIYIGTCVMSLRKPLTLSVVEPLSWFCQ